MIPFNIPPYTGEEEQYIAAAIKSGKLCGDGQFTKKCSGWLEAKTGSAKALLTTSCTDALEMAAVLCGVGAGDEVIKPSYTFPSTADAFVMRGATVVFVDIRPDTMNMDEEKIEAAITDRTKVIAPVHYAGVGCEMDRIMQLARAYGLMVAEDAAQGVMSAYKDNPLGTFGNFGCLSFHETKNYSMGEGGAILIRDEAATERAEIIREKGTDRSKFLRGQVDKYTWVDCGSSYLPSELNAAYLYAQLNKADMINNARLASWERYYSNLSGLAEKGRIVLPTIPDYCKHNAHMFYIKTKDIEERTALAAFLKENGVTAIFHYIPLHSSPAGRKFGRFSGEDVYTTKESERLLRLPMYYGLADADVDMVCELVERFYSRL